jgi:4-amino-4-deoxy-L-arabinose transferase-like glycosyltransferase
VRFATDRGEVLVASPRSHVQTPAARWFLAALGGLAVLRLAIAAYTPVIDDEAYYWNWSRHLSLSYLDHPPLVAWLDALTTSVARTEWLLRVPAMLASLATTLMLYRFGWEMFGTRAGIRAAALHLAVPIFALQAIHAIPDPLLYAWWTAGLWTFWRAVHGDRAAWWGCGVALGLGLLSKYPMALLPVTWLFVLAWPRYRHLWRTPGPYLAAALSLVLGMPVIVWNARHGWAALWFWLRAGQPGGPPLGGTHGWDMLREVAVQFGYAGPLSFPLLLWAVWKSWRLRRADERFAYLALAALPTLLLVAAINLRGVDRPNWPAPAYLASVLALGALWPPRLGRAAVASGLALSIAAAVLIAVVPWLPPALRWTELYGWREVSAEMVRRAAALGDPGHVVLLGQRYNEASYFGYYTEGRVPVSTGQFSEFSFLAPSHRFAGWQGIAAIDSHETLGDVRHGDLLHDCAGLTEQPAYDFPFPGGGVRTFRIFHCSGFRGTPPAP